MSHFNSVVCGPKFTNFFGPTRKRLQLIMAFSDFRYDDPFRRYSRSKSKVVKNCPEFWTFFSPSQILGGGSSENCTRVITPGLRHVNWKKFYEDTPTRSEVIVAHTLNFKPSFKFSRLKFFWGLSSQFRCALASLGKSVARVNISGRSTP